MTTWYRSTTIRTLAASVNTPQALLAELNSFFTDCAAEGASFRWQIASYQSTSPFYLVLKRKDASAGRVMFYGASAGSISAAAQLAAGGFSGINGYLHVCYDPTATTDTPPTSYLSGNPWSAANSLGRGIIQCNNSNVPIHRIRAYCSDDGQLYLHGCAQNSAHYYNVHVGPIFRAASGGTAIYEGVCVQGARSPTGQPPVDILDANPSGTVPANQNGFGNPELTQAGLSGSTQFSFCSAYVGGAWYQINRVTGQRFGAATMSDSTNRMHFIPIFWAVTPDSAAVVPWVLKSKNLGAGPCRTLDAVLVDNAAATRGFYIGYHGTQGTDRTALSILNDDI